LTKLM